MNPEEWELWASLAIGIAKDQRDADLLDALSEQAKATFVHYWQAACYPEK